MQSILGGVALLGAGYFGYRTWSHYWRPKVAAERPAEKSMFQAAADRRAELAAREAGQAVIPRRRAQKLGHR